MKNIKKFIAILSVITLCISVFTACGKTEEPESNTTTTTQKLTTEVCPPPPTEKPSTTVSIDETTTEAIEVPETTTTITVGTTATTKPPVSDPTTSTTKSTTKATTKATTKTTTKATTKKSTTKVTTKKTEPTTKNPLSYSKAEIIKTYNNAINKVISSKAGYTKSRTTNLSKLEGAEAIMKIKVAADAVNGFLGVGTKTYTNNKGESKYMSNSAITEAEVKSAKIEKINGDVYKITLILNDGSSTSPSITDNSPLRHSGLYVGKGDKSEFDYKNADNLYVGINGADGASVQSVSEQTTNTTIVAQVNIKTGKLSTVTYKWNWNADLKKVKYTIVTVSGTGKADSSVTIKDIKW